MKRALAATLALAIATPAYAAESADLGRIAGTEYNLFADQSACFATTNYPEASITLGIIRTADAWTLSLSDQRWKFQEGQNYDLRLAIDGTPLKGTATAISPTVLAMTLFPLGIHEFTAGQRVTLYAANGRAITTLNLAGTTRAFRAVGECYDTLVAQVETPFSPSREQAQKEPTPSYSTPFAPARERGA